MPTRRTIDQALEAFRADDALSAQAYESTPPELRARLKTAIAFQCHLHAESPASETHSIHRPTSGFQHTIHEKAAAWTVAVIEPDFDSPARLLAALMPAVLAGVERVFVVTFGANLAPSLLVALELAGLENIFVLPPCASRQQTGIDPLRLLTALFDETPDGRLLLFPTAQSRIATMFADLARVACHLHLPVWQDAPPRLLMLCNKLLPDCGMTLESLLLWAHGNVFVKTDAPDSPEFEVEDLPDLERADSSPDNDGDMEEVSLFDACYAGQAATPAVTCNLTLGAGMEACWNSLPKGFFRTRSLAASLAMRPEQD